jgi:hypothetical protein
MFLSAEKHISGWDHAAKKREFAAVTAAINLPLDVVTSESPSGHVSINVMYWRKANQIHEWFVDNVQDGKDECQRSFVEREKLETLLALCEEALKEKNHKLLPPCSGFFFGGTEIDESYWQEIKDTAERLRFLLENPALQGWDFYYQASW